MDRAAVVEIIVWVSFVASAAFVTDKLATSEVSFWKKFGLFIGASLLFTFLFGLVRGLIFIVIFPVATFLMYYLGLPIGFEPIKLRIFVARVQAELKAQYGDQNFVNLICQLPETLEGLNQIRKNAHYRNDKIAPFLAACYALGEGLEAKSIDSDTKAVCAKLLSDRLQKARTDMHFYMRRFQIFGDLQSKLEEWREAENA